MNFDCGATVMVSCEIRDDMRFLRGLMIDVTEARRLVREMAQGQKLESVGRIAAGVAHEINTSVQFISDSVRFVEHEQCTKSFF